MIDFDVQIDDKRNFHPSNAMRYTKFNLTRVMTITEEVGRHIPRPPS